MMVQQAPNQVMDTLVVIVVEQLVLDMFVDEPLMLDEQLVIVVVEELSKAVDDTMMDCTEVVDCCSMEGFTAALAVLIIGASQSRQHGKSESDLTSHLLQSLFDVGSGRNSIVTVNTFKYHSDVLAKSHG
ncbi:hypothetical protein Tco_1131805 [Tanacetum coccineum]|uniref:Uncharacterized protein n=1 Tax=Tanacetum coccineum TaxID=301880 RepID=A0ABQ5JAQ6_9ASTR